MDNIWKFGRSTLWASVSDPAGQMKKRRITSLTSGFSAGIFLQCLIAEPKFVGRSILENPTSNLYRLSHALPLELLQVIIDLAWECSFFSAAAVFQQSRYFSSLRECLSTSISLLPSEPVFLGHLTYGDFRYISYISNERRALSDEQIFRASMTSQLKLAIDDIGIRRICFIEDNKDCTVHEHRCASTDEVVYRSLQTCDHGPLQRIFSSTDSLFLRNVKINEESPEMAFDASLEWDTQCAPMLNPRHCYLAPHSITIPKRYRWVPLDQGMKGIIACYSARGPLSIHAWHGEKNLQWLSKTRSPGYKRAVWLFFPLRPTESISDVVVREMSRFQPLGLMIQSTLGRSHNFGPYWSDQQAYDLTFLNGNNQEIVSGICFNMPQLNHQVISHIGITCKPFEYSPPPVMPPSRHYDPPERLRRYPWFFSNAPLTDIKGIQLCRDDRWPERPYVGMLLTYQDESQAALGQWRWDASIETATVGLEPQTMRYKMHHDSILEIEFHPIGASMTGHDDTWSNGRMHGELVWWFNGDSSSSLDFQST